MNNTSSCIFCQIITQELPAHIIATYEHTIVIKDRSPKADLHWLVIPKLHIEDLRSSEVSPDFLGIFLYDAHRAVQEYAANAAWKCIINNGYEAGQRVFHLHAHILSEEFKSGHMV